MFIPLSQNGTSNIMVIKFTLALTYQISNTHAIQIPGQILLVLTIFYFLTKSSLLSIISNMPQNITLDLAGPNCLLHILQYLTFKPCLSLVITLGNQI